VQNGIDDPVKENEAKEGAGLGKPWIGERRPNPTDLRPVKRQHAQSHSSSHSKERVDKVVPRLYPADEREVRQRLEEIA
jgi:hypothetical protein